MTGAGMIDYARLYQTKKHEQVGWTALTGEVRMPSQLHRWEQRQGQDQDQDQE
jgi:hypothetical protein